MRRVAVGALAVLGALLLLAPAASARRALIAFVPAESAPRMPLLFGFAQRHLAFGVTSPTLGGYTPRQMLLDVSQGTRISGGAYSHPLGPLSLSYGMRGGNRVLGWFYDAHRADTAPGEVVPGLFGATLRAHGLRVAYSGVIGAEQAEATVAAGRHGGLGPVSLGTEGTFAERTLGLWRRNQVVVARLPAGAAGLAALDRILAARGPGDLVYALRAPPAGTGRLLPTGIAGPGFRGGVLTSATTRQEGLVSATDLAPTVLHYFGIAVPHQMQGRVIESRGDGGPEAVHERMARLGVILGRRGATLNVMALCLAGLFAGLGLARRRAGLRAAARIAFLAVLWLPGCCLVTAALRPGRGVEVVALAVASLALGALTDRFVRWPLAPVVPAAVVFGAHAIDLARGSPLIDASIAGPNPQGGARFFGIGNELEIYLSLEALFGLGAALTLAPRRWVARGFALGSLVAAAVMGAGRLGADVGAVITLGAGAAGAVLASFGRRPSWRAIAVACLVPVVAILALIGLDLVTSGGAHLTRTVIHGDGAGGLADILRRRLTISLKGFNQTGIAIAAAIGLVAFAYGLRRRAALLAPLRDLPAWRAALWGGFWATVVGALANDSGPVIFALGFLVMLFASGYAHGSPASAVGSEDRSRAGGAAPAPAVH